MLLVISAFGEVMNAFFTLGNVADNHLPVMLRLSSRLKGWAFADKGFINQKATEGPLSKGLYLVTGIPKNLKNKLLGMEQKLLLKKHGPIEGTGARSMHW